MGDDSKFKDIKDKSCRCLAFFCIDHSCAPCCDPCLMSNCKFYCISHVCESNCDHQCGCCELACDKPVYSEEQGCCEQQGKQCCCYVEQQCPPSMDIGLAFCGVVCLGQEQAAAREYDAEEYAPMQEAMNA